MKVFVSWHCDQNYDNDYNTDVEEDDLHNKEDRKKVYGVNDHNWSYQQHGSLLIVAEIIHTSNNLWL